MKVIYRSRRMGKIYTCLKYLVRYLVKYPESILIVFNSAEKRRICSGEHGININPNQVMTWKEYIKNMRGIQKTTLIIDNLDLILSEMLQHKIKLVTINKEEEDE